MGNGNYGLYANKYTKDPIFIGNFAIKNNSRIVYRKSLKTKPKHL